MRHPSRGRRLLDQGENKIAIDVLQLNQVIHGQSPRAANALGDAYRDSGEDIPARIYYDMALNLDPENEHAKKATAEQGNAADLAMGAMGDMEVDPEATQQLLLRRETAPKPCYWKGTDIWEEWLPEVSSSRSRI